MKKNIYILLTLLFVATVGLSFLPSNANAADVIGPACQGAAAQSALCNPTTKDKLPAFVKILSDVLLYVLGSISVIVIIFAAIFYTTSSGDPALVTKAKNTLIYAVVGLIVAISGYAIINFVITRFI